MADSGAGDSKSSWSRRDGIDDSREASKSFSGLTGEAVPKTSDYCGVRKSSVALSRLATSRIAFTSMKYASKTSRVSPSSLPMRTGHRHHRATPGRPQPHSEASYTVPTYAYFVLVLHAWKQPNRLYDDALY